MKYSHRMKTLVPCIALVLSACGTSSSGFDVEMSRTDRISGQTIFTAEVKGTVKADVEKSALERAKGGCPKGFVSVPVQQRSAETLAKGTKTFDVLIAFVCTDPNEE